MRPGDQTTNANTEQEDIGSHWGKLEERHLHLIDVVIGGWIAVLGILTTFIYEDHRIASYCLFGSICAAISLGFFLEIRHRFMAKPEIVAWPIALLVGLHVLLLIATGLLWAHPTKPTFRLVGQSAIKSAGEGELTRFVATDSPFPAGNDRMIVHPIDLLTFVEISNLLPEPRYIRAYWVEAKTGWFSWERLCPVPLNGGHVTFISDDTSVSDTSVETSAFESSTPLLDDALKNAIGPEAPVSGWTAWQCQEANCASLPLRLVLIDKLGRTSRIGFSTDTTNLRDSDQFAAKAEFEHSRKVSLDVSKFIIMPREICRTQQKLKLKQ